MKTTIVPAQITTVEDTIAGGLNMTQMALLTCSGLLGLGVYAFLTPRMHFTGLKAGITILVILMAALLALRFRGRLIMVWAVMLVRYNFRPRYYVYDKNDPYLRGNLKPDSRLPSPTPAACTTTVASVHMHPQETIRLNELIHSPLSKLTFKSNRRGQLRVFITQIK